ncbi:SIR2 family protein, partial [Planktotalea sp.]|uniref:SIR2 family protein n=1 Tax=Planktotalea sp. TaxID=2029877 RepID=UPI003298A4E2
MSDNEKIDFFLKQREELRDWPYTVHQLDDTLDMNLIEGRGKQLFFQGINTKRLTGFVGSGLSMAYGRMSWRDWKKTQLGAIEQFAKSFEDLSQESLNRIEQISALMHYRKGITAKEIEEVTKAKRLTEKQSHILTTLADVGFEGVDEKIDRHNILGWLKNRERAVQFARKEILKLHRLFKHANDDDGGFPGGEDAPIQFQVAEQLHTLLRQYTPLFVDLEETNSKVALKKTRTGVLECKENGAPLEAIKKKDPKEKKRVKKLANVLESLPSAALEVQNVLSNCGSLRGGFTKSFLRYFRIAHKPESRLSIEDMAKSLLVDECAHAEHLLLEGLRHPHEVGDPAYVNDTYQNKRDKLRVELDIHNARSLSRNVPGIRQDSERYKVLSAFTLENCITELEELLSRIKGQPAWEAEVSALVVYLKAYFDRTKKDPSPSGQRYLLTPTSRFLVSVAMRLESRPKTLTIEEIKPENFTSRRSIVADRLDPLPKLVDGLNIHRFMTLNYDFEIERYFQDVGFRNFAVDDTDEHVADMGRMAQSDLRYDGVGAALRDLAFERGAASELISFAGGRDGAAYGVYHLHGRATQSGRLVINEHDYMELYLQEDENRETVDEAISMAFAANPLVFVGLGMNEADLLRPLRQFTSNRDHNTGYNAIALVPAEDGFSRRAKFSSGLYIRYGVHTIFYGSGAVKIPKDGGDPDLCSIDWLHRILALVRALTDLTKQRLKDGDLSAGLGSELSDEERAEKTLDYLEGKVGIFGEDLVQAHLGFDKDQHALPILMGRRDLKPGDFEFANPNKTKLISPLFTTVRGGANEQEKTVRVVNRAECLDGEPYLRFYLERLNSVLHMTVDDKSKPQDIVGKRDLSARLAMLDGIYGAIITASLNAALAGLQAEHQRWWQNWRQCPPYRSARFERLGVLKEHQSFSMPRRHVRHRIHNTITTLENAEKQLALPIEADSDEEKLPLWVHKPSRFDNPNRTGVRTHDTFISAVARERLMRKKFETDRGRRIYTIAAHRGLGKGSLMSAMATPKGLSGYIHAAWDHEDMPPLFTDAIFVNLSFSSEIASVYDMIDDALLASIAALGTFSRFCKSAGGQKETVNVGRKYLQRFLWQQRWTILDYPERLKKTQSKIWKLAATDPNSTALIKLYNYLCYLSFVIEIMGQKDSIAAKHSRLPRLERLRVLAKLYREESETVATEGGGVQPRVFMFLSAMDMLFTSDRLGKNKEIEALIALLT